MNLLCPNCQKMLTVPEQYAGQLMKCPLCGGTFTVPALPAAAGAVPSPAPVSAPQPPLPPPAPTPAPAPGPEVFSLRDDGPPHVPPAHAPDIQTSPSPSAPGVAPIMTPLPPDFPSEAPAPSPLVGTEEYRHTRRITFNPRALQWIAPVCVVLIFIFQFFNWVGVYPGGVPVVTQGAWGAGFGHATIDPDIPKEVAVAEPGKGEYSPGASVLTIFYLLLFLLILLPATLAPVILDHLKVKLPPGLAAIWPWRWGIVAAANLVVFLFLGLQLLLGFSLETTTTEKIEKQFEIKPNTPTAERKMREIQRGAALETIDRTFWLRLVVFLHLIAIVGSALMYWVDRRGPGRPLPVLELRH